MKPWHFAGVGLAVLATLGCRTDPAVPILERELRVKEDEIYRLRGRIEDMQDCAVESQPRAAASKRDNGDGRSESSSRSPGKTAPSEPASGAPPKIEFPSSGSSEVPPLLKGQGGSNPAGGQTLPKLSPGPSAPGGGKSGGLRPLDDASGRTSDGTDYLDGPALAGPPRAGGAARGVRGKFASTEREAPAAAAAGDSRRITAIALDPMLTGGLNDDAGGDKGLLVVVEPRDAENRIVDAPAEVSIVVLDPALLDREGYATRVARWDFTAGEIARMFRRTSAGPAIHIEAAWSDGRPTHSKLHVFVRYTTSDGRRLEADRPIEVATAGEKAPRPKPAPTATAGLSGATAGSSSSAEGAVRESSRALRPWSPERR